MYVFIPLWVMVHGKNLKEQSTVMMYGMLTGSLCRKEGHDCLQCKEPIVAGQYYAGLIGRTKSGRRFTTRLHGECIYLYMIYRRAARTATRKVGRPKADTLGFPDEVQYRRGRITVNISRRRVNVINTHESNLPVILTNLKKFSEHLAQMRDLEAEHIKDPAKSYRVNWKGTKGEHHDDQFLYKIEALLKIVRPDRESVKTIVDGLDPANGGSPDSVIAGLAPLIAAIETKIGEAK